MFRRAMIVTIGLLAAVIAAGQCRESLPAFKKKLSAITDPQARRTLELDAARCAMNRNQPDEAVSFVQMLSREFPSDPEVLYLTVHLYSDLSIRASQKLLQTAPESYQVRLLNAEALETQGKWQEAAAEYRTVLARDPRLPGIHYRLGRLLLSQPRAASSPEEARKEFEEELKVNPANAGAEFVLGELARQAEQWPEAIEHFSRATKLDPGFADAFLALGRSMLSADRAAEAIAPLEVAVKLQPDNPVTHFQLATAYRRSGRKADADREFAAHRLTSEKARQVTEQIQKAVTRQ